MYNSVFSKYMHTLHMYNVCFGQIDLRIIFLNFKVLQKFKTTSVCTIQEEIPDLDAAAREFYNEIRALSIETGGSIENILESIGASTESLASIIPLEKREQLANFEMNLKQMIEEAKQLADESPGKFLEVKKGGEFNVNMFNVLIV